MEYNTKREQFIKELQVDQDTLDNLAEGLSKCKACTIIIVRVRDEGTARKRTWENNTV